MKISIIVPVYNNAATIEASLTAITALKSSCSTEIIVVDDGSTDSSFQKAQAFADKRDMITVYSKKNGGEASALNFGVRQATGDFIATLEADVEPLPDWLIKVMGAFKYPAISGAGGCLLTPRSDPWPARLAGYEVELKLASNKKNASVSHITSANAIYKRSVFEEHSGYNEQLMNASLDSDLNQRITQAGGQLLFVPDAKAVHHYKTSLSGYFIRQFQYARFRPYMKRIALYPFDRLVAIHAALCGVALLMVCVIPLTAIPVIAAIGMVLAVQVPFYWRLFHEKKDPTLLVLPVVIVLRNWVALGGYLIGFIEIKLKKKMVSS